MKTKETFADDKQTCKTCFIVHITNIHTSFGFHSKKIGKHTTHKSKATAKNEQISTLIADVCDKVLFPRISKCNMCIASKFSLMSSLSVRFSFCYLAKLESNYTVSYTKRSIAFSMQNAFDIGLTPKHTHTHTPIPLVNSRNYHK